MSLNILHSVMFGPPVSSGYTIRTHSIVKAQKKIGLVPNVAISLHSLLDNFFTNNCFDSKIICDGINYYSAKNELFNDLNYKLLSKFMKDNNRVTKRLRRDFYSLKGRTILEKYTKFLLDEINDIDIIHSHTPSVVFDEADLLNKTLKKKLIYEIRGFWSLSLENHNQDILESVKYEIEACNKADRCVAICKGIADVLVKGGVPANKIDIIPNGVDPEKFVSTEKDRELQREIKLEDKLVFGYITNIRWLEGIQTIIKGWKRVTEEIPNAVFLLVGDGAYLGTLRKMIEEVGIQDSFLTIGKVPHEKIGSYYSLIDVFVVPRTNVPVSNIVTPLKPLEAMINSKALIVSDVDALKEMVINGETGIYFNADNPQSLADKCIQLAYDYQFRLKLGRQAKTWVLKNRTWDKLAFEYSDIYSHLLK